MVNKMRWITPHFFMSVCFRQVDCFCLQVKFVDDSVRQADNRNMDIRGSDNIGDSQENFTSRNDYIRAVGFMPNCSIRSSRESAFRRVCNSCKTETCMVIFFLFFLSARRYSLLMLPPEPMILVCGYDLASSARSFFQTFPFTVLHGIVQHTYRTDVVRPAANQLAFRQQVDFRTSSSYVHIHVVALLVFHVLYMIVVYNLSLFLSVDNIDMHTSLFFLSV